MAPVTDSTRNDRALSAPEWAPRISVRRRILAINVFALAILVGGFLYLDSYRVRLIDGRISATAREAMLIVAAIDAAPPASRAELIRRSALLSSLRLRLYGPDGTLLVDSFALAPPTYRLRDPADDPLPTRLARLLDKAVEAIVFAPEPPALREPKVESGVAWPEVQQALKSREVAGAQRFAPDRTPFLSAAVPMELGQGALLATTNARDITEIVRAERLRIGLVLAGSILVSILLSLFLARTIVLPLRRLARAAVRVRLGRAREVIVPRLPERRDEIGMLARAISDMSQALRQRIDATDAFAADVSHELKNPIASLRSALEGLTTIKDAALRERLLEIAQHDVLRLDRLVTDIADASRLDGQLSRARFARVELGALIGAVVQASRSSGRAKGLRLIYRRPAREDVPVMGDARQLVRVIENVIDNACSFSPSGGAVRVTLHSGRIDPEMVEIIVDDEGPGVPESEREKIFERFHSVRPSDEAFGRHSGLGLAIARTIVESHNGTITAEDKAAGKHGARFVIILPLRIEEGPESLADG
jgi:two-component system, OmpR family, sensor histidine kinase ChvG